MGATINMAIAFHSVADDSALAVAALRRERLNRALKTVENMLFAVDGIVKLLS
jgi:hypothetical protein